MVNCRFVFLVFPFFFTCLVSCSSKSESPATSEARLATVSARATYMAGVLRMTDDVRHTRLTATVQAWQDELVVLKHWPVLLYEAFDEDSGDWYLGEEKGGEYADILWEIVGGKYRWQAVAKQGFVWWNRPAMDDVSDFYVTVDARLASVSGTAQVGLIFRQATDDRYYAFSLREDSVFSLDWHDEDGWTSLIEWTSSGAIKSGEINRLGVLARGDQLNLFVNDRWLAQYPAEYDSAGSIGLLIGMEDEGKMGVFEFDNFEVRVPE